MITMGQDTSSIQTRGPEKWAEPITHAELCTIASRWLKVPNSRGGHGCQIAFTEARIGQAGGEIPDTLGFRISGWLGGSVMIECKTSRSDFLADAKKPHRKHLGMGRWRYYMCPEGIITPSELPPRWGLLVVTNRRRVRAIAGAAAELPAHSKSQVWPDLSEVMDRYALENDSHRESQFLASLLHRIGDAEATNLRLREAEGNVSRLAKKVMSLQTELNKERNKRWMLEAGSIQPTTTQHGSDVDE